MKKITLLSLFTLAVIGLSSCGHKVKNKDGSISGRIMHAENKWISLQKITEEGDQTIDSVRAEKDGKFKLKNPATNDPDFYLLRTNETNVIFLVLKKGEDVVVTGDADKFEKSYQVKGSKDSELLQKLRSYDRLLSDSLNKVYTDLRNVNPTAADSMGLQLQGHYTKTMEAFAKDFIRTNLSSIVSLSATRFLNQQSELTLMTTLEDSLVASYPQNRYVNDYRNLMTGLKKLPPGSMAPEITANTPNGKTVSLSSLRGKIVLVDFWASWCGPCRRENPAVVELYKKYKNKNFEIFGVSLDDNLAAWKTAINADKITWPQVSELKKWDSKVVKEYNIDAIPYSVLIDRDGKIIAKGLRTEELEIRLMELLKGV